MNEITNLILQECKIMFIESALNCDNKDYILEFGLYPSTAIIKYHDKFSKKLDVGNTLLAWIVHKDFIKIISDISIEPKLIAV